MNMPNSPAPKQSDATDRPLLPDFGLRPTQEPKYSVNGQGRLVVRATRVPIPDSEPVFIIRGKDRRAVPALREYLALCEEPTHRAVVGLRIADFESFQRLHPDLVREPDSASPAAQAEGCSAGGGLSHEAVALGTALADLLAAAGMVREDADLTGPHLLQFAAELAADLRDGSIQITRSAS